MVSTCWRQVKPSRELRCWWGGVNVRARGLASGRSSLKVEEAKVIAKVMAKVMAGLMVKFEDGGWEVRLK